MTIDNFDTDKCATKNQPSVNFVPVVRWTGIALLTIGWGSLLFFATMAPMIPGWVGEAIHSIVTTMNNHYRWIPPTLLLMGLVGICMLVATVSWFHKLRSMRVYLLTLGLGTAASIGGLGLAVDSQPPGSALAMFISMFGSILFLLAILGLLVGIIGLILFIPAPK